MEFSRSNVDPKDARKRWVLLASLGLTAIVTIGLNLVDSVRRRSEVSEANHQASETRQILLNLTEATRPIPQLVTMLQRFGFTPEKAARASASEIENSFAADSAYDKLLARRQAFPATTRSPIHVQYFPKDVDGDKVTSALRAAGYEVEIKRPVRDEPTNSVWAGDDVSVEDAHLVAFALTRAGVQLQSVSRFANGSGPKARLIQVGADARKLTLPVLGVEEILNLRSLARDFDGQ